LSWRRSSQLAAREGVAKASENIVAADASSEMRVFFLIDTLLE
jgi:hypothetical protein